MMFAPISLVESLMFPPILQLSRFFEVSMENSKWSYNEMKDNKFLILRILPKHNNAALSHISMYFCHRRDKDSIYMFADDDIKIFVAGILHVHDCSSQPLLPVWHIVAGSTGLVVSFYHFYVLTTFSLLVCCSSYFVSL